MTTEAGCRSWPAHVGTYVLRTCRLLALHQSPSGGPVGRGGPADPSSMVPPADVADLSSSTGRDVVDWLRREVGRHPGVDPRTHGERPLIVVVDSDGPDPRDLTRIGRRRVGLVVLSTSDEDGAEVVGRTRAHLSGAGAEVIGSLTVDVSACRPGGPPNSFEGLAMRFLLDEGSPVNFNIPLA